MTPVSSAILNEFSYARRVRWLWQLGPRATGELLAELAAISGRRTWLDDRLDAYANLDRQTLDAVGANDWPEPPLLVVAGSDG